MASYNMITLTPAKKKHTTLYGFLSLPMRIGERAFINYKEHSIMTSPVKKIWEVGIDRIVFETQNTIYTLQFSNTYTEAEVMCA